MGVSMNDRLGVLARRYGSGALRGVLATNLMLATSVSLAQQAPDTSDALEEITVTAQFVKQNLQETPVAITAVTAATLEARGHESIEQIANQTPNVTLTT